MLVWFEYPLLSQEAFMGELEDIPNESLAFLGSGHAIDNDVVHYSQIGLRTASKVSECRFAALTS